MEKYEITTTENKGNFAIVAEGTGAVIRATTSDDNKVLFNAINGQGEKVKDNIGVELDVVNIVVTSADVAKDFSSQQTADTFHQFQVPL